MGDELVVTIRLNDGSELPAVDAIGAVEFDVSILPDRDPLVASFSSVSQRLHLSMPSCSRFAEWWDRRNVTIAMKRKRRRLTITTNDDGLDVNLLGRGSKDFYRDD